MNEKRLLKSSSSLGLSSVNKSQDKSNNYKDIKNKYR